MSVPFVRNTAISRPVQRQPFSTGLTMPLAENTVFVPQIINNNATIMVPNNINTLNNITQRTLSATQKLPVPNLYSSTMIPTVIHSPRISTDILNVYHPNSVSSSLVPIPIRSPTTKPMPLSTIPRRIVPLANVTENLQQSEVKFNQITPLVDEQDIAYINTLMDLLPQEMVNEILLQVNKPSLYQAAQVCKQWRHLAVKQVVPIKNHQDFNTACTTDDRLSIIKSKFVKRWLTDGFEAACLSGHQELVQLLITKGANRWNIGLEAASIGGHEKLAQLMITKGADEWNTALYGACQAGHEKLVQLLITQGADDLNIGLDGACENGHQGIVQLMITQGANECWCGKSLALH